MPVICVHPDAIANMDKLEYLKSVAPEGIVVGKGYEHYFAQDGIHAAAYIFDDWSEINYWADEVPAWLITLATGMERKTLTTVKINLILGQTRRSNTNPVREVHHSPGE